MGELESEGQEEAVAHADVEDEVLVEDVVVLGLPEGKGGDGAGAGGESAAVHASAVGIYAEALPEERAVSWVSTV